MVGVAVAITTLLRLPPLTSYCTLDTPDVAVASRTADPDTEALFDGSTTTVVGAALLTVTWMPGLVPVSPPEVAMLCSVYVPFGTVVGSTLAAVLIAELASALVFVNVSPYWIHAVQGVLILVTVVADILRRHNIH